MTGRDKREPFIYLFVYFFRGHTITHEIRGTNHAVTRLLLTPDTYTETRLSKYKSSLVTVNTTITCTFTHACTTAPLCGVSCKIKTKHTDTNSSSDLWYHIESFQQFTRRSCSGTQALKLSYSWQSSPESVPSAVPLTLICKDRLKQKCLCVWEKRSLLYRLCEN